MKADYETPEQFLRRHASELRERADSYDRAARESQADVVRMEGYAQANRKHADECDRAADTLAAAMSLA